MNIKKEFDVNELQNEKEVGLHEQEEDDDDDDLVEFISVKKPPLKSTNEVLTPRKAIKPTDDSSLPNIDSPCIPVKTQSTVSGGSSNGRGKMSLSDLLKEKDEYNILNVKEKYIVEKQASDPIPLPEEGDSDDDGKPTENVLREDEYSQDYSQTISTEDTTYGNKYDDGECSARRDNVGGLATLVSGYRDENTNDFSDSFPGRYLFTRPIQNVDARSALEDLLKIFFTDDDDTIEDLSNFSQDEIQELLFQVLDTNVGVNVDLKNNDYEIVWKLVYLSDDYTISQTACHLLTSIIQHEKETKGANKNLRKMSVGHFVDALIKLGTNPSDVLFIPEVKVLEDDLLRCQYVKEQQFLDTETIRKVLHGRLFNIEAVVRFFTVYVQCFPLAFSTSELKALLIVCFHLVVDKVVQLMLWDVRILIGSILDAYSRSQWPEESVELCCAITSLSWHHRDLLHAVECIPPTERGLPFQQILSYSIIVKLVDSENNEHQTMIDSPVTPEKIYDVLCCVEMNEESDYWKMFTVFSLVGVCSKSESNHQPNKYISMQKIVHKLSMLNYDVKEHMGRHLDRTKVKNLLILLIKQYKYRSEKVQTQSNLDTYFGKSEAIKHDLGKSTTSSVEVD